MKALPSLDLIRRWPAFTPASPLRVLVSGCLAGLPVGVDGSTNGSHDEVQALIALPNVSAVAFCPENFSFGTPRATPDISNGDGYDVLDGKARVVASSGEDWTDGMIAAAREMVRVAQQSAVQLAILMDISAACGSQVIYLGARARGDRIYQRGPGVAAALLIRHGIPVVSQRDYKTLGHITHKLGAAPRPSADLKDHHEIEWYRDYFQSGEA